MAQILSIIMILIGNVVMFVIKKGNSYGEINEKI